MKSCWRAALLCVLAVGLDIVFCKKAVLMDVPDDEKGWSWTASFLPGVGAGWTQPSGKSYSVCDVNVPSKPSNWLMSDPISLKSAKGIEIDVTFTMHNCSRFSSKYCSHTFDVYLRTANAQTFVQPPSGYQKIQTITGTNLFDGKGQEVTNTAKLIVNTTNQGSYAFIAFHDQGACVSLKSVEVSYYFCPPTTATHLTSLPRTVSPYVSSTKVAGICVANSEKANGPDGFALCKSDGTWDTSKLKSCQCVRGFTQDDGKCTACPSKTYKATVGNTDCLKCPDKTEARMNRTACDCSDNFYRSPNETVDQACTAIPESPTDAKKTFNANSSSAVNISWTPGYSGGRSDVYYEISFSRGCAQCGTDCKEEGRSLGRTTKPSYLFTKLKPCENYTFYIRAGNGVTETANTTNRPLLVEVYPSIGQPVVVITRVNSTAVRIEWSFPDGDPGVKLSITYCKKDDQSNGKCYNLNAGGAQKREIIKNGLEPNAAYIFQIQPVGRRGLPTKTLGAETETTVSTNPTGEGDGTDKQLVIIVGAAGGGLVVIVVLVLLIRSIRRRQRRNGYGKPQGTEMFSRGLYIDPNNYADPLELLRNFASEIDQDDIKIDTCIGGGEFGDVYKGVLKGANGPTTVAVKILKQGSSPKNRDDFLFEASIMGQFDHMNVIRLEGVITKSLPIMIITEFMENGSLENFLRSRDKNLTHLQLIGMARGVAAGMEYLAAMNFIHRDLAARNILVGENMASKVADFGLSRELDDDPESEYQTQGGKIAIRWTAPEALRYRTFSSASDVWSFGIVLWEIMSFAERPYWDWDNFKVMDRVQAGFRMPAPLDCPKILHGIMMNCWEEDKNKRPKFSEIVKNLDELIRSPEMLKGTYSPTKKNATVDFEGLESISGWLNRIKMEQYAPNFEKGGYHDLRQVSNLDDAGIRKLGVTLAGHRNKIAKSIKAMKTHFANPALEAD